METTTMTAEAAGSVTFGGDFTVHRIGLGTNRITDTQVARALLRRAVELGINFIDTADIYQSQKSEETIGKTFSPYPQGLVIATKGGMVPGAKPNGTPEYLRKAIEGSLQRLRLERIELYQLHRVDPETPIEVTVGFLRQMQNEGKIHHIGLSEVRVDQLEQARKVAEIVSVQNRYNISDREHEDVLHYAEKNNIVFIPYFPLRGISDVHQSGLAGLTAVAQRHHATPQQIALNWLLHHSPAMLPIPGTLSIEHLEENIAAVNIRLSEEEYQLLDRLGGK